MSLTPSSSAAELVTHLRTLGSDENIAGMARFGIVTDRALGISNTALRAIARIVKRDHQRALLLWESGIREARLLAAYTEEPERISANQARACADTFNSWEMVDGWADVFVSAGLGPLLIPEFAGDDREFVRRLAFAMIAWSAVHLKNEPDGSLLAFLPLIEAHATDPRNFVRKAVNWALRQIGKRSPACCGPALALARKLADSPDRTARWNGRDAVRELSKAQDKRAI